MLIRGKLKYKYKATSTHSEGCSLGMEGAQQKINPAQLEIFKRLQRLQGSMVGGERVNDRELKEKRLKKKRAAEQRLNALAKIIAKVEDEESPHLVLKVYDDIQEELRAKTELLRKSKQRVKVLDREIQDLQSEFENERTDYLETIRRQERQMKLYSQIFDNILPALSKECNYRNLDRIKDEARWCEESQCWLLPSLMNARIKLPPAGGGRPIYSNSSDSEITYGEWSNPNNGHWSGGSSDSRTSSSPEIPVHRKFSLDQKFYNYDIENFAGNYFKPRRAAELLMQAKENAAKSINKWKGNVQIPPDMLPKRTNKIDLLPLIREKGNPYEKLQN
ncbi:hypothetical protein V9T40_000034 [Parthenolecanium corni]|uniref:Uncharacterized protein n=1 Tax=Parthenolecanium corni TaxID=536013 RepID=A0AAN9TDL9_9HEMI